MRALFVALAITAVPGCAARAPVAGAPVARLGGSIEAACDSIADFLEATTGIRPERSAAIAVDWSTGREHPACRLELQWAGDEETLGPDQALMTYLESRGWRGPREAYAEELPAAARSGYVQGDLLCLIEASWDPGNETDSTYVPRPGLSIRVEVLSRPAPFLSR